jgi:hypothetical protein
LSRWGGSDFPSGVRGCDSGVGRLCDGSASRIRRDPPPTKRSFTRGSA